MSARTPSPTLPTTPYPRRNASWPLVTDTVTLTKGSGPMGLRPAPLRAPPQLRAGWGCPALRIGLEVCRHRDVGDVGKRRLAVFGPLLFGRAALPPVVTGDLVEVRLRLLGLEHFSFSLSAGRYPALIQAGASGEGAG